MLQQLSKAQAVWISVHGCGDESVAQMKRITPILGAGNYWSCMESVLSPFLSCEKVIWGSLCFQCQVSPRLMYLNTWLSVAAVLGTVEPLSDGASQEEDDCGRLEVVRPVSCLPCVSWSAKWWASICHCVFLPPQSHWVLCLPYHDGLSPFKLWAKKSPLTFQAFRHHDEKI